MGIASIDGLGPRGIGFHTKDEQIEVATLVLKAQALARFLHDMEVQEARVASSARVRARALPHEDFTPLDPRRIRTQRRADEPRASTRTKVRRANGGARRTR